MKISWICSMTLMVTMLMCSVSFASPFTAGVAPGPVYTDTAFTRTSDTADPKVSVSKSDVQGNTLSINVDRWHYTSLVVSQPYLRYAVAKTSMPTADKLFKVPI